MSNSMALVCGGDAASHRFPLFRVEAVHTTVCDAGLWWAVTDPHQSVARLCVENTHT